MFQQFFSILSRFQAGGLGILTGLTQPSPEALRAETWVLLLMVFNISSFKFMQIHCQTMTGLVS
jgi:hypothetical protein